MNNNTNVKLKKCSDCGILKEETEENFHWRKDSNKFRNKCKDCLKIQREIYREINLDNIKAYQADYSKKNRYKKREYNKKYYYENIDKILEQKQEYYENNSDIIIIKNKEYSKNNSEKIKKYQSFYREEYKDELKEYKETNKEKFNKYIREKRKNNIEFKLRQNMINRFRKFLKIKHNKSVSAFIDFDFYDFINNFNLKINNDMTWENYGKVWHIDHIIPLSYFKCITIFDPLLKIAWSLENLQPLEAKENHKKINKIIDTFEAKIILLKIEKCKNSAEYKRYLEDLENGVYDKYLKPV